MLLPRGPVLSVLLLLLLLLVLLMAAERCHAASRTRGSAPRAEGRLMPGGGSTGTGGKGPKRKGRSNHDGNLRDPKNKEKFIGHLTGPLYFKPKCRRQFHRLYHNTRDCTVPAYYKRCARLLTQLAKSPRCAERKTDLETTLDRK